MLFFFKGKSLQMQHKSKHFLNFPLHIFVIAAFTLAQKGKFPSQYQLHTA